MAPDSTTATTDLPSVMTVGEIASYLGLNRKTIYAAIEAGELPAIRIRGRIRILRGSLLRWLHAQDRVTPGGENGG